MVKKPGGGTSLVLLSHLMQCLQVPRGGESSLGMDLVPRSSDLMLPTCIECVVKKVILVFRLQSLYCKSYVS